MNDEYAELLADKLRSGNLSNVYSWSPRDLGRGSSPHSSQVVPVYAEVLIHVYIAEASNASACQLLHTIRSTVSEQNELNSEQRELDNSTLK